MKAKDRALLPDEYDIDIDIDSSSKIVIDFLTIFQYLCLS